MPVAATPLRVAVVEDQPLFRDLLVSYLNAQDSVSVVFEASTACAARQQLTARPVDVAVLDIALPDGNGLELGLALREQNADIGILLLSSQDVMEVLLSVPKEQRSGWSYLSKNSTTSSDTLLRALRASSEHRSMLDPSLVHASRPRAGTAVANLTDRQLEALQLLASGLSNRALAEQLGISTHSVENLLNSVYTALDLTADTSQNRRVAAVLQFLEHSSRVSAPTLSR